MQSTNTKPNRPEEQRGCGIHRSRKARGVQAAPGAQAARGAAWRGLVLGLLVLVAGGAAVLAYKKVKQSSQPIAPVMTDADWQQKLVGLQERVNAAGKESGSSIAPLIAEIQDLAEQSQLKGPGYQLLGQARLMTGDFQNAYNAFVESLKVDTGNSYLEQLAGTAAFELGVIDRAYFGKAAKHYERALELKPDDAALRLYLAEALIERNEEGDRERGLFLLTESLGLDDSLHAAHYRLSGLRLSSNQADSALTAVKKALERVDPYGTEEEQESYWRYQAHHAKVLIRLREYQTALGLLLKHPDKDKEPLLSQIAACHAQLGHPRRAAAAYEILTLDQLLPDAHLLERAAHWRLITGDTEDIRKANQFIQMYQNHPAHDPALLASLQKKMTTKQVTE